LVADDLTVPIKKYKNKKKNKGEKDLIVATV
jgi:hypothetical protein